MNRAHLSTRAPISLILAAIVLVGCGGGGSPAGSGRAVITILWPSRSRLIPVAAESIKIEMLRGASVYASTVVARPVGGGTASVSFDHLPLGSLTARATAYPQTGGSGVAQAVGSVPLTITAGSTTPFTVTMNSTIDHLELGPASSSVMHGLSVDLSVTAKDAAGNVVLVAPSVLTWTSSNTAYATVSSTGDVTAVKPTGLVPGPIQITVKDNESGKSATASITVTSAAVVTISPKPATVPVRDSKAFTATVSNATDTSVTWTVVEGSAGGTITDTGIYIAPNAVGTYHVKAVSKFDGAKSDTCTVTVQSGGADVIID